MENAAQKKEPAARKTLDVLKRDSANVRESARDVHRATEKVETEAQRTTRLAADRTVLAAERTYAAWVRTGLFALASGIGARALLTGLMPEWLIIADSTALVAFSIFCFGAAIWRELKLSTPPPEPRVQRISPVLLVTLNGFLAIVSLAAGIGILADAF
jgi:putative membrane protein